MTDAGDAFEPEWASALPTDATTLDDAAVAYAELGFRVLPVWGVRRGRDGIAKCQCSQPECKKGKHPIGAAWQKHASSDVDRVRAARQGKPNANIGLAMGGPERLVAVDIDGEPGRVSWSALEATHGPAPETLTSATGREDGGEHQIYRVSEAHDITRLRTRANAGKHPGIDTRIEGGQIVVAPSMHESGARYRWTKRAPIAELPGWLYEALATPLATVTPLRPPPSRPAPSGSRSRDFAWRYVERVLENAASEIAACPPGQRNDKLFAKSATVFEYFVGENFDPTIAWNRLHDAGIACGMSQAEVRTTLAKAKKRVEGGPGRQAPAMPDRPEHAFDPALADVPFEERAREHEEAFAAEQEADDDPAWDYDLQRDGKGNLKCSLANVLTILSRHPDWRGAVVWDDFARTIVKRRFPPVREGDRSALPQLGEWTEGDTLRAITWIAANYNIDPGTRTVDEAILAVAERTRVHPVREYLAKIVWDQKPRLDRFLVDYFGAVDTPYARGIASRWMISAVARAHEPGVKADCTIVLESTKQGIGKSSGIQALVPEVAWFADTPLTIGSVDSYQCLRAKWIYELGELAGLKGRDVERIKNFLSAPSDNFRSSYGKRNQDSPRQMVFAATTNERHDYLVDRTGNRRFWPVEVFAVDRAAIVRDRDQLWAEAVHRYRAGEEWHANTDEFRALCEAEQQDRVADHQWLGPVDAWLRNPWLRVFDAAEGLPRKERADLEGEGVTTNDVLQSAIGMRLVDIDRAEQILMGRLLGELGLEVWRPRDGQPLAKGVKRAPRRYRWPSVDGPTGGEGLDHEYGPEKDESIQSVAPLVQVVHTNVTYAQVEQFNDQISLDISDPPHSQTVQTDHPGKTSVGRSEVGPASAPIAEADPLPEVREPLTTDRDRRALDGILARVRKGGQVSASASTTSTGSPPRAAPQGARPTTPPTPPSPRQGPATGQGRPVPRPSQGDEEPDDFKAWFDAL